VGVFIKRWRSFWFEPAEPTNLGICRVLFFGAFFLYYLRQDFSAWAGVAKVFWMPIPLFQRLALPVFPASTLMVLQGLWKTALALSCLGFLTRVGTALSFILGTYLVGLPHNFGRIYHVDALVVIVFGIMAIARCGDACSIDRWIYQALHASGLRSRRLSRNGEYTWPVRAVWLAFALIFVGAGVSKLKHSGLAWIFSDNLEILLIRSQYRAGVTPPPLTSWGLDLAQHPWLCRLVAATTVAFEIAYPLALFSRKARWVLVPTAFLAQVGFRVLMGPAFYEFLICNLFWVPWDRVSSWLAYCGSRVRGAAARQGSNRSDPNSTADAM
jgi:hypothetical protein